LLFSAPLPPHNTLPLLSLHLKQYIYIYIAAPGSWAENLTPIEREIWARLRQQFSHKMTEFAAETKLLKDEYDAQVKRIDRERVAARNELRAWLEERNVPLDQVKMFKKVLEHEKVMREARASSG